MRKFFLLAIVLLIVAGCTDEPPPNTLTPYRELPGVTQNDIDQIEALRNEFDSFSFAMLPSSLAFEDSGGEINGFVSLFSEWLTELFEIKFMPQLLDGETEPDFTASMPADDESLTTGVIARNVLQSFRLAGAPSLEDISQTRLPRYVLIENTHTIEQINYQLDATAFELILVASDAEAYEKLYTGEADIFFSGATTGTSADPRGYIISTEFFPPIYNPTALSTANPQLAPIINIVQLALDDGALSHLTELYNQGKMQFQRSLFLNILTPQEILFIQNNPLIPYGTMTDTYPVSFFNEHENEWQGIAFDVLDEVSRFTGLQFERQHEVGTPFFELREKLIHGEVAFLTELLQTSDRDFLWASTPLAIDRYALISHMDFPNLNMNEIYDYRVGLPRGTAFESLFKSWFPHHDNYILYDSYLDFFEALQSGEIDLVMASQNLLLMRTHFEERVDVKVNIAFDYPRVSAFGFRNDSEILHSIFNKALLLIETEEIAGHWTRRTFEYHRLMDERQRPFWILAIALLVAFLAVSIILFARRVHISKHMENIIDKRTAELKFQTAAMTTLVNTIPDVVFAKDLNLKITHVNKAYLTLFGRTEQDVIGKTDGEVLGIPPTLAERFNDRDRSVINTGEKFVEEEFVPAADGSTPFFETIKVPLIIDGETIGVMGVARDISVRKELEDRLEAKFEYTQRLNNNLGLIAQSQAVLTGDLLESAKLIAQRSCKILNVSKVGIWKLNESKDTLKAITVFSSSTGEFTTAEDFSFSVYKKYSEEFKTERLIVVHDIPSQQNEENLSYNPNLCALLEAPVQAGDGLFGLVNVEQLACDEYPNKREWSIEEQSYVSSLADIMALVVAGNDCRKAQEAAVAANLAKSDFLATMSHEIRTPMNSIIGFTELALDDAIPLRTKDYLSKIKANADWLLQIINDILDLSKIESGKIELEKIPFDMHDLFASCRTLIMPKTVEKGLVLHFYAEPSVGKMPLGDPTRLRQVLVNLLSNAVKFTNSGIIKLMCGIKEVGENTVTMLFEIKDSGIGMTSEQIARVYEPFVQAETGTTRKYGGTGLGLSITRNILHLMDTSLCVESVIDVGSKFSFELTFGTIDTDSDKQDIIVLDELTKPVFVGEVLVCEDSAMNQQVICDHLTRVGLRTVVAKNGQIAVDIIKHRIAKNEKQFGLIFMDIHMPVMDGIEATQKIIELNLNIPIVALTANIMTHDTALYKQTGMHDHLSKPFTSQELWRCLMKYFKPLSWQKENNEQILKDENKLREKLISNFVKSNKNFSQEISDAIKSDDIKLAHRLSHTLKGNAGQLHKTLLQRAAEDVEMQLVGGKNNLQPGQLDALKIELDTVLAEFAPMLEASSAAGEALSNEETLALFERLAPLLIDSNPEAGDYTDLLRQVKGCDELIQQIESFDFKPAVKTLAKLKKMLGE